MRKMRGIAFRLFKANRFLITTSIISIIVSTLLILTMLMYSINAQHAMKQSFKEQFGETDLMVSYASGQPYVLTKEKIDRIIGIPEIEQSAQVLHSFLKLDNAVMSEFTIGTTSNELTRSTYKFSSDITTSTVILNQDLATFLGVVVGDELSVEGKLLRVSEIIENMVNKVGILIVHPDHLRPFMKNEEQAKGIMLKLVEDTEPLLVVDQLKQIDPEFNIELQEENEAIVKNMQTLQIYIVVLSVLIAVITSLLVVSNFEIILYKLNNQIAILRSIGASTRQVSSIILFQSLVINIIGVGLGTALALLGMNYLFQVAQQVFHLPPAMDSVPIILMLTMAAVCFIVFQLFMLIPAYRSTKILPLKIAEENERLDFKHKKRKSRKGKILIILSITLYIIGYVFAIENEVAYLFVFAGILLFFIGSMLSLPQVIEKILTSIFKLVGQKTGRYIYLAFKNMLPQVKKNTFAIVSISIIMMITLIGSTLLSTLNANNNRSLYEHYETPIILFNRLAATIQTDPIKLRQEVMNFSSIRNVYFESAGDLKYIMKGKKQY